MHPSKYAVQRTHKRIRFCYCCMTDLVFDYTLASSNETIIVVIIIVAMAMAMAMVMSMSMAMLMW